jgi:hypothetical protein
MPYSGNDKMLDTLGKKAEKRGVWRVKVRKRKNLDKIQVQILSGMYYPFIGTVDFLCIRKQKTMDLIAFSHHFTLSIILLRE